MFSAFLINLLLGILFLLGSNIAIVCDDLPDYKLLQKVSPSSIDYVTVSYITHSKKAVVTIEISKRCISSKESM